jgi:hypothetical protein
VDNYFLKKVIKIEDFAIFASSKTNLSILTNANLLIYNSKALRERHTYRNYPRVEKPLFSTVFIIKSKLLVKIMLKLSAFYLKYNACGGINSFK